MDVNRLMMAIADNQQALGPTDRDHGEERAFKRGVWEGLQIAYNLIEEEQEDDPIKNAIREMRIV
jgi:hypothetical protein